MMVEVLHVLLGLGIILFIGYFSEFLFQKTRVPDVLILIFIGFIIGPYVLGYVNPDSLTELAPIFTTFTLLFLLFEGGLQMNLKSIVQDTLKSMNITLFNFIVSVVVIFLIMLIAGYTVLQSVLTGFILGGISSAFVIPLVRKLKMTDGTASVLTLESALSDILCIVFAFAVIEIISANTVNFLITGKTLIMLFVIAGIIGFIAGLVWVLLIAEVFKSDTHFMLTIAYMIIVYVFAEFLGGNGAIATLALGITLKNSQQITRGIIKFLHKNRDKDDKGNDKENKELEDIERVTAITHSETTFYKQISFFLKTFFFVYIGLLFNVLNLKVFIIGIVAAVAILFARRLSYLLTKDYPPFDRELVKSIFARGLAAAAIAQLVLAAEIPGAQEIAGITYNVIIFTIILSSGMIFWTNYRAEHPVAISVVPLSESLANIPQGKTEVKTEKIEEKAVQEKLPMNDTQNNTKTQRRKKRKS